MNDDSDVTNVTKNISLESYNDENINAFNCSLPSVPNTESLLKNTPTADTPKQHFDSVTEDKTVRFNVTPLKPLELSQTAVTSYMPPAAQLTSPFKTPASQQQKISNATPVTPNGNHSTPIVNAAFQTLVQNDSYKMHTFCKLVTPTSMTPRRKSMYLIDFTTPDNSFHTPSASTSTSKPVNQTRLLLKSALGNSTRRNLGDTLVNDDSVQQSFVSSKESQPDTPKRTVIPKNTSKITSMKQTKTPKKSPPPSTVVASLKKKREEATLQSVGLDETGSPAVRSSKRLLAATPNRHLITSTPFVRSEREKGTMFQDPEIVVTPPTPAKLDETETGEFLILFIFLLFFY